MAPMWMEWNDPVPDSAEPNKDSNRDNNLSRRIDSLLPISNETGAVTETAFKTYLNAFIQMVSRKSLPLSLISVATDKTPLLDFLGPDAVPLISKAIARCIHQETRDYDILGHHKSDHSSIHFLVACPLASEEESALLAQRFKDAMTTLSQTGEHVLFGVSIGIASHSLDASTAEELIARAMDCTRRAMKQGGNTIWKYSDTIQKMQE